MEPRDVTDATLDDDDERELASDVGDLGERLRSLLDPGADLTHRTGEDISRTLRGRSALATGLDLLGLGVWTARTLLSDPHPRADEESEGI
jgi:hypothetical protein